jgi:hypothetical protein
MERWQLDRHISLGHLLTTATVAVAIMVWMFKLEGRVSVVESNINHMQATALQARTQADQQYAEIIRRLERIDDNLNKARVEVP